MRQLVIYILMFFVLNSTAQTLDSRDSLLYKQYIQYCDSLVQDTAMLVGYAILPQLAVTYTTDTIIEFDNTTWYRYKGTYLTQNVYMNSLEYNNPLRKKTYKNIDIEEPEIPTFTGDKELRWFQICYMCKLRYSSIYDFYNWYIDNRRPTIFENP